MRPPKADYAYSLLCEDVRTEQSGHLSLIKVIGYSLEFEGFPAVLPTLCSVVFIGNPSEQFTNIIVQFAGPRGQAIATSAIIATAISEPPPFVSQHLVKWFPVVFSEPGEYIFKWSFGEDIGITRTLTVKLKRAMGPTT